MNTIINLKGVKPLSTKEQKLISGGFTGQYCSKNAQFAWCIDDSECPIGSICCPLGNCSTTFPS